MSKYITRITNKNGACEYIYDTEEQAFNQMCNLAFQQPEPKTNVCVEYCGDILHIIVQNENDEDTLVSLGTIVKKLFDEKNDAILEVSKINATDNTVELEFIGKIDIPPQICKISEIEVYQND